MKSPWHFWFYEVSEGTSTCQRNYLVIPHGLGARARMDSKDAKGLAMLLTAVRGQPCWPSPSVN